MASTRTTATLSLRLLQWATLLLLVFRGQLYIVWDSPIRNLLWDESAFSGTARRLGWAWADWVTDPRVNAMADNLGTGMGIAMVVAGVCALVVHRRRWWWSAGVGIGGVLALLHVLLSGKSNFFHAGYYIEMTLQWATPFLLLLLVYGWPNRILHALMRVAIALTFTGHGLYAVGYYPVPADFVSMMMGGLGLDNATALATLRIIGWLDFLAASLLLLPARRWWMPALFYTIGWGALTSLARVWSYTALYSADTLFTFWMAESLLRWVHFLVPLALWLRVRHTKNVG